MLLTSAEKSKTGMFCRYPDWPCPDKLRVFWKSKIDLGIFVTKWLPIMEIRRDVFQAIADPTRREIIQLLAGEAMNLNGVAEHFDISRPAISKHIKILTECGLVVIRQEGRERYCDAQLQKLKEVALWTERYSRFWDKKLNALQQYLGKEKKPVRGKREE
jgi:DNA-binding transcriptional ArsR family regulator